MAATTQRLVALSTLGLLIACAALQSTPRPGAAASAEEPSPGESPVAWSPREQEPELGQVRWRRDYDKARAEAKTAGLPLFVLFDEVPG